MAVSEQADQVQRLFKGAAWECLAYDAHADSVRLLRAGLPEEVIGFLSQLLKVEPDTLRRTIGVGPRYQSNRRLQRQDGDKVYRAIKALVAASRTLGFDDARMWLCRPIRSLGGVVPLSMMDTEAGFEMVIQTLGRIEHGVVS